MHSVKKKCRVFHYKPPPGRNPEIREGPAAKRKGRARRQQRTRRGGRREAPDGGRGTRATGGRRAQSPAGGAKARAANRCSRRTQSPGAGRRAQSPTGATGRGLPGVGAGRSRRPEPPGAGGRGPPDAGRRAWALGTVTGRARRPPSPSADATQNPTRKRGPTLPAKRRLRQLPRPRLSPRVPVLMRCPCAGPPPRCQPCSGACRRPLRRRWQRRSWRRRAPRSPRATRRPGR